LCSFPINASEENMPYVLYRTFQEGIIYKEDIYKLEGKSLVKSNVKGKISIGIQSFQEAI